MPGDAFSWSSCCEQNEVMFEAISLPSSLAAMPLSLQADKSVSRAALTKTCSTQGGSKRIQKGSTEDVLHTGTTNQLILSSLRPSKAAHSAAVERSMDLNYNVQTQLFPCIDI